MSALLSPVRRPCVACGPLGIHNELTVLERGEHLKRRKEIYEALHPDTKAGGDKGNQYTGGKPRQNGIIPFSQDAATKTGRSRSTVEQEVKIAAMPEAVKAQVRGTAGP